ncbi:helix-turn-helix domain-containing protein [Reyranella sp. CPCC 100927]|uniref:helix-turn-helix domain-containing protein n=1 Tax=Reyranella sp. CPCC 100927 TaxID=2599616 RepID=UPI0011B6C082|nr:helix-turn-helix domain-containing protein [Reyranella sp. CPCC 100927]TWT14038.1 MerR family transcriptional regulator [Reyranella sp. CPCC 100927]
MRGLDIAEVARQSGVAASALRFYERKGLIASIGRRGLKRLFEPAVLERLALITLGQAAGFSLDEMALMFAGRDGRPDIDRRRLTEKADALDDTIRRLTAMRDGLRHAARCPAPSHWECPTFRRYLNAAAAGAFTRGAPLSTTPAAVSNLQRSQTAPQAAPAVAARSGASSTNRR